MRCAIMKYRDLYKSWKKKQIKFGYTHNQVNILKMNLNHGQIIKQIICGIDNKWIKMKKQ